MRIRITNDFFVIVLLPCLVFCWQVPAGGKFQRALGFDQCLLQFEDLQTSLVQANPGLKVTEYVGCTLVRGNFCSINEALEDRQVSLRDSNMLILRSDG